MLTLGSLFDGIGGFPFCAELSGVIPVWASEIDPACIAVTRQHFPNMQHLGNISKINGATIPPVDIITFGSPCQDLSVAGQRKGIKHAEKGDEETTRSGLFLEAIRIIYEMRAATYGKYPTYIVWENVPGAFNSQRGRDFQTVLQKITKADISIPPSGRWSTAGVVRGGGICVAWRQLDAQYWGVPQRRKRIYLIGSFGDDSAAEILFKPDSVQGYLTQSGGQREGTAAAAENGVGGCGSESGAVIYDARGNGDGKTCPTITGDHNGHISDYTAILTVPVTVRERCGCEGGGKGLLMQENKAGTIATNNDQFVVYSAGFLAEPSAKARSIGYEENKSPTLRSSVIPAGVDCRNYALNEELYPTLQAKESGGQSLNYSGAVLQKICYWIVRRLTPLECERLQGYPDYWTVLPKISDMSDEDYAFYKQIFLMDMQIRGKKVKKDPTKVELIKWYNKLDNDGARYRMLGNSLAIPCALRVIKGIADYVRGDVI